MVIEDEIDDDVIEEVDQRKEVSNSNSRSEEQKVSILNARGDNSNEAQGYRSSNIMFDCSEEFKNKSKFKMGLEEEKVETR